MPTEAAARYWRSALTRSSATARSVVAHPFTNSASSSGMRSPTLKSGRWSGGTIGLRATTPASTEHSNHGLGSIRKAVRWSRTEQEQSCRRSRRLAW